MDLRAEIRQLEVKLEALKHELAQQERQKVAGVNGSAMPTKQRCCRGFNVGDCPWCD